MDIVQNLKDVGCDADMILNVSRLYDTGRLRDVVRVLRRHRCGLTEHLHESQSRVDCLDDLVYQLERALKEEQQ